MVAEISAQASLKITEQRHKDQTRQMLLQTLKKRFKIEEVEEFHSYWKYLLERKGGTDSDVNWKGQNSIFTTEHTWKSKELQLDFLTVTLRLYCSGDQKHGGQL